MFIPFFYKKNKYSNVPNGDDRERSMGSSYGMFEGFSMGHSRDVHRSKFFLKFNSKTH